jgi:membrane protein implicated in regulation of membrane protease activity
VYVGMVEHPDSTWPLRLAVAAVVEGVLAVMIAVTFEWGWILGIAMLVMAAYLGGESLRQWRSRRDAHDRPNRLR